MWIVTKVAGSNLIAHINAGSMSLEGWASCTVTFLSKRISGLWDGILAIQWDVLIVSEQLLASPSKHFVAKNSPPIGQGWEHSSWGMNAVVLINICYVIMAHHVCCMLAWWSRSSILHVQCHQCIPGVLQLHYISYVQLGCLCYLLAFHTIFSIYYHGHKLYKNLIFLLLEVITRITKQSYKSLRSLFDPT